MASRVELVEHARASGRLLGFGVLTLGAGSLQLVGGAVLGVGARSRRFRTAVLQAWARSLTWLLTSFLAFSTVGALLGGAAFNAAGESARSRLRTILPSDIIVHVPTDLRMCAPNGSRGVVRSS